jgi:hypothetical protein
MATKNDVTGDKIKSKIPDQNYRDNWDRIFGKKKEEEKNKSNKDK